MFTDAKLGADNVVPQPFFAAGLVLAGLVCKLCVLSTLGRARLCQLCRCSRLHSLRRACAVPPGAPGAVRLPLRAPEACRRPCQLSASDRFLLRRTPIRRVSRLRVSA